MRANALRRLLGACLLGLGAAAGCHRCTTCPSGSDCPTCSAPAVVPHAAAVATTYPQPAGIGAGYGAWTGQTGAGVSPYAIHATPAPPPNYGGATAAAPHAPATEETAEPGAPPLPVIRTGPVEGRSLFPRNEPPPPRRSFADVTADACFAHAKDYGWLRGRVEYSRLSKGWRLRYASVDEDDRFGGSVTLADGSQVRALKDGDLIEVRGRLADPGADAASPLYQVESLAKARSLGAAEPPAHAE
ncbi:MAG TPA: hypothetical protein VFE78_25010 [Gemmataceae bacterium]|jgi:hypothetical protein|nr:hypothetical protein [Gemmataceae bacterium]